MKFKPVPESPESLDFVADVQRAVPLVPGTTEDCCARVMARAGIPSQDEARRWLTFLRALGLARETERGFARTREAVAREALADAFEERVFGATDVLEILDSADEPLDTAEVFERFENSVPTWERHHDPNGWRDVWGERVERLLEWSVLFGLVERTEAGYRAVGNE